MENVTTMVFRRPKQTRLVHMKLDNGLVDRIDRLAARQRKTRTELVRQLLLGYLEEDSRAREEQAA